MYAKKSIAIGKYADGHTGHGHAAAKRLAPKFFVRLVPKAGNDEGLQRPRTAVGAGTAVVDGNRVLKQYETMQQMVKQLNSKGMKKKQKRMGRMGGGFPGLPGGFGF